MQLIGVVEWKKEIFTSSELIFRIQQNMMVDVIAFKSISPIHLEQIYT